MLFGKNVHTRSEGEIVRILRAAVQHHDQRQAAAVRPALRVARHEQLVIARTGGAGVSLPQKLRAARRRNIRRRANMRRKAGRADRNEALLQQVQDFTHWRGLACAVHRGVRRLRRLWRRQNSRREGVPYGRLG